MKYITGQQVYDEYNLDYQQLADKILKGKIRCYNQDHEEIVDAKTISTKENLCSYGRILSFSINIPNMFLVYPDFLEKSEVMQIDGYGELLPDTKEKLIDLSMEPKQYQDKIAQIPLSYNVVKFLITKENYNSNDSHTPLDKKNKLFSLSIGKKLYYNGVYFSFANYQNKDNSQETIVTIEIPDITLIEAPIPLNFVVCSYRDEDINKILLHLNTVNEIYSKFESNINTSLYSLENFTENEKYLQDLFSKFKERINKFCNDFESLPFYLQYYFYDTFNCFKSNSDKLENTTTFLSYFEKVLLLYKKFFNKSINEILFDNLNCNLNEILSFNKNNNIIQQVDFSNIEKTELSYILYKKDEDKLYVSLENNIISHNGIEIIPVVHNTDNNVQPNNIYDTFYIDFEKNKEQLINANKSKKMIESFQYAKNYQIIHRDFYPNKKFKKDYYYFDINEFLKFYPSEVHDNIKVFYHNTIKSFLFSDSEINDYKNELNELKRYAITYVQLDKNLIKTITDFYSYCHEIFLNIIINKNKIPWDILGKKYKQRNFLCSFYIYYYELMYALNKDKDKIDTNIEVYDFLLKYNLLKTFPSTRSKDNKIGRINTALSRYRIKFSLDNNINQNCYHTIFPFIPYEFIQKADVEKIKKIFYKCKKSLSQLNIIIEEF